jgi:hypothetical protein
MQQPVAKTFCQGGTTREHNVSVERFSEVHVGAMYGLDHDLVYAGVFEADDLGIEEDLRRSESLCANLFSVSVLPSVLQHLRLTFSFCPSGNAYSTLLPSDLAAPDHSFSSFAGSSAT